MPILQCRRKTCNRCSLLLHPLDSIGVVLHSSGRGTISTGGDGGKITRIELRPVEQELTILPAAFQEQERQRMNMQLVTRVLRQPAALRF